jgi:hypothetical protein
MAQCEIANFLPHFRPSLPLAALANPQNTTNAETPLNILSSTFLCAATEILAKYTREIESPLENVKMIEESAEGWEPCTGYTVVRATTWGGVGDEEDVEITEELRTSEAEDRLDLEEKGEGPDLRSKRWDKE